MAHEGKVFMAYAGKIPPRINHIARNMKLPNYTEVMHLFSMIEIHMK
jgi:hypothetical protein